MELRAVTWSDLDEASLQYVRRGAIKGADYVELMGNTNENRLGHCSAKSPTGAGHDIQYMQVSCGDDRSIVSDLG